MGLAGSAVLAIWADIAPGGDDDYNHWHTKEHIPERVGVPGFLRGRRYVAISGAPRYFMLYEAESLAVLDGPAYVERLNTPTPWTRRVLALFRNTNRTACRVTLNLHQALESPRRDALGGALATLRLGPAAGREQALRAWLADTALPALLAQPVVIGAYLCEADPDTTGVPTEERKLRGGGDELADWVVMVEGLDADSLAAACRDLLDPSSLPQHGAVPDAQLGIYRLHYSLSR